MSAAAFSYFITVLGVMSRSQWTDRHLDISKSALCLCGKNSDAL